MSFSIWSNLHDLDMSTNLAWSMTCLKDLGAFYFVDPVAAIKLEVIFIVGLETGCLIPSFICKILR